MGIPCADGDLHSGLKVAYNFKYVESLYARHCNITCNIKAIL